MKYLLACFAFVALGAALGQTYDGEGRYGITNGTEAAPHKYPWMARLMRQVDGEWEFICGGSLITGGSHVITAAHCVDKVNPDELKVILGDHCASSVEDGEMTKYVEKVIVHEEWDSSTGANDIALLKFFSSVSKMETINSIRLSYWGVDERDTLVVAGWGTSRGTTQEDCLNEATTSLVPCDEDDRWPGYGERICASSEGEDGRTGPCSGDSGGPLMKEEEYGYYYVLVGIVSGGDPTCENPGLPVIYTNVYKYQYWISENTWN